MVPDLGLDLFPEILDVGETACGAEDELTGAVCTRPPHTDRRHSDEGDWAVQFKWDEPRPSLVVPD